MSNILPSSIVRIGNDNFATCGFATLVNGEAQVNITELGGTLANYKIFVTHYNVSQGASRLYVEIVNSPFFSFNIKSFSVSDDSTVSWFVILESTAGFNTVLNLSRTCSNLLLKKNYNYGNAQLTASEVTINTPFIKSGVPVILSIKTPSPTNPTPDVLYFVSDIVDYTSFKIRSNQDDDTAIVSYLILNPVENWNTIPGSLPGGDYTTLGLDSDPSTSPGGSANYGFGFSLNAVPWTLYTTRASNDMSVFFTSFINPSSFLYPLYVSSVTVGTDFTAKQVVQYNGENSKFSWLLLP